MKLRVHEGEDGFLVTREEGDSVVVAAPEAAAILLGGRRPAPVEPGTRLDEAELSRLRPAPVVAPGKIVAIGLNYQDHVDESGNEPPERPLVFAKFPSTIIGDGDEIVIDPSLTKRVDWEVELAVVIGEKMRYAAEDEALDGVFGYTVANDVSGRDVQFADGQWVRGKSFDTFCPVGPVVVTADEVSDPQTFPLRTRINGETVQDSNTASMIFSVAEILAFCSASFTLEPGDLVLTGTPWGCGEFMDPVRSLGDGDLVECEIDGIGKLTNRVREVEGSEKPLEGVQDVKGVR